MPEQNRRSGDNGNSIWTKESILKYVDERFDTIKEQVKENDSHLKEFLCDKISTVKESISIAMSAADKATAKAETAMDKRLEGMNEFRNQMGDQQRTFLPRAEYNLGHTNVTDKMDNLEKRLDAIDNKKTGGNIVWAFVISGISFIGMVIGIIYVFTGR